jgi:hypothetical protein
MAFVPEGQHDSSQGTKCLYLFSVLPPIVVLVIVLVLIGGLRLQIGFPGFGWRRSKSDHEDEDDHEHDWEDYVWRAVHEGLGPFDAFSRGQMEPRAAARAEPRPTTTEPRPPQVS